MPKIEIDYSNTIVYKIACNDHLITDVYVGITTNFIQRKYAHKLACNNIKSSCYNFKLYKTIRAHGNWSNWNMSIINYYNCKDLFEAKQKEQEHFIALNANLNSVEPLPQQQCIYTQPLEQVNISQPLLKKYSCSKCSYNTDNLTDLKKHLHTEKHIGNLKCDVGNISFFCKCGKIFKTNSGLWKHNKKCISNQNDDKKETEEIKETELGKLTELFVNIVKQNQDLFIDVVKQNQELQKTLLEMSSKMIVPSINTTNNTNNNNTTNNFNLQIFLNETCKDALNLTDFVSSLQVKLKDLEETAKNGYTEGVSRIFINGLNELDVNMRPIHCSDAKRETLYIKNNDEWTKEDADKSNITKAVKRVSNKNIQQIFEWQKKYTNYKDPESKQNDRYQEMLFTAMGGSTDEEQSKNLDKIIRNITKEVIIDKNA